MLQDIIRLTVTRVIHDKMLLGLLIVGILSLFVGSFPSREQKASVAHHQLEQQDDRALSDASNAPLDPRDSRPQAAAQSALQDNGTGAAPAADALDPKLATDFVKWWIQGSMDYSVATAVKSHETAFAWMTPEAKQSFESALWAPDVAQQIQSGQIAAAFQPASVQAAAVNPDGTVVVVVSGNLVTQGSGTSPSSQQIQMDLLVKKESAGLRVAGVYNRVAAAPPGTL